MKTQWQINGVNKNKKTMPQTYKSKRGRPDKIQTGIYILVEAYDYLNKLSQRQDRSISYIIEKLILSEKAKQDTENIQA